MNRAKHTPSSSSLAVVAVATLLVAATTLYLPYVGGLRVNRELLIAPVAILAGAVCLWRYTWAGSLLSGYVGLRILFSPLPETNAPWVIAGMVGAACVGLATYPRWRDGLNTVLDVVAMIVLTNVAMEVMQAFGLWIPRAPVHATAPIGLMSNADETSVLLGIAAPVFFRKGWWKLLPLVVLGIILSRVWIGMITLMACLGLWLWREKGFRLAALSVVAGVLAMVAVSVHVGWSWQGHVWGRLALYEDTEKIAMVKPVFGWGLGQYRGVMPLVTSSSVLSPEQRSRYLTMIADRDALYAAARALAGTDNEEAIKAWLYDPKNFRYGVSSEAHNDWLEGLFAFGSVGFALMVCFAIGLLVPGLRLRALTIPCLMVVASCISAFAFFTWQIVPLSALTVLAIIVIHGGRKDERRQSDGNNH